MLATEIDLMGGPQIPCDSGQSQAVLSTKAVKVCKARVQRSTSWSPYPTPVRWWHPERSRAFMPESLDRADRAPSLSPSQFLRLRLLSWVKKEMPGRGLPLLMILRQPVRLRSLKALRPAPKTVGSGVALCQGMPTVSSYEEPKHRANDS